MQLSGSLRLRSVVDVLDRRLEMDLTSLRPAGAAMLGLAALLPRLPHHPGLPCPLRTLTGVPCPLCGMATSVEAGVRFHLRSALAANPFGIVAIAVALALLARPAWRRLSLPLVLLASSALVSELLQLHRFHFV